MRSNGIRCRSICALLLASSVLGADAQPGVLRLRRMVVVGDSLLAGFGSGGFVGVGRPGQVEAPQPSSRGGRTSGCPCLS